MCENALRDRTAFEFVGVEERIVGLATNDGAKLEAEVQRVAKSGKKARAASGQVNVRRIASETHAPAPVGLGEAAGIGEAREPASFGQGMSMPYARRPLPRNSSSVIGASRSKPSDSGSLVIIRR